MSEGNVIDESLQKREELRMSTPAVNLTVDATNTLYPDDSLGAE